MTRDLNRREVLRGAAAVSMAGLLHRAAAGQRDAAPIVRTNSGRIAGVALAAGGFCFKGVPYGRDTSETRFAAPQAPATWQDVRQCVAWGPRAPQVPGARPQYESGQKSKPSSGYELPADEGVESEDCLHLNVWTPGLGDRKKRPVMVYIHGGAYANGTVNAELYDGARLARRGDIVVVTVNHRLNLFGYMYLAELLPGQGFEDSGNAGQLDLVLALQWVRDNIASFGGDPSQVTIFGQSGGGAKCATLMAQPPARGLFHRVWTMSGQQVSAVQPAHATDRARAVLLALGLDPEKPSEAASALRKLPMRTIQAASRKPGGYFGPVRDGRSLPGDPFTPVDPSLSADVPMVLGNTHDETRLLIGGGRPELFALTWESLPEALEKDAPFLKSDTLSLPVADVIAKYRAWHPAYTPGDVFFGVTTDSRSWRGEVIEAEARARDPAARRHTWVYELDWKTPVDGGRFGAPHTLDIPLIFDNVLLSPGMVGNSATDVQRAQQMADIVCDSGIAFARKGDPHCTRLPHWPSFSLDRRQTMIFDLPSRVEEDPRGRERRYLGQVPYVQPGT